MYPNGTKLLRLEVISLANRFPTQYDKYKYESKTGERMEPIYSAHYDEEGNLVLLQTGKRDIYDEIQSHKDSVDVNLIVKRYTQGDTNALNRVQGLFVDFDEFPKDYQGVLNTVSDAEQVFAALPVEIKNHFGNSFSKWLVAGGLQDFVFDSPAGSAEYVPAAPAEDVPAVETVETKEGE